MNSSQVLIYLIPLCHRAPLLYVNYYRFSSEAHYCTLASDTYFHYNEVIVYFILNQSHIQHPTDVNAPMKNMLINLQLKIVLNKYTLYVCLTHTC